MRNLMFGLFIMGISIMIIPNASAITILDNVSISYKNDNGVELTEKEYEYVNEFYGEGYFESMTEEDYEWISNLNINENDVTIITSYGMDVSYSTDNKTLKVTKSCNSSSCIMNVLLTWINDPNVRSYDVIGARFDDTSLYSQDIETRVKSSTGSTVYSNLVSKSNGIGVSVKLPSSSSSISVNQQFEVTLGGTVYVSYQHATKSITLANSMKYSFSSSGYGSVFSFDDSVKNYYDKMAGVKISM